MLHAVYVRVNPLIARAPHVHLWVLARTNFLRLDAGCLLPQDYLVKLVPIVEIV
jgi:hypothetical protein